MSEGRALLTDKEREALAGEHSDNYRYKTRTYLKRRIEKLEEDITLLEKEAPGLLDDLRNTVCEGSDDVEAGAVIHTRDASVSSATSDPEPQPEPEPPGEPEQERGQPADPVEGLELEGSGSVVQARKDALRAIVDHLREEGSADISVLKEIAAEYDFGYKDDVDNYWSNMRRQNALDELPVETPGQGARTYRYAGEE